MRSNNLLSSLCYLSVFFAPFFFPIIVYFLSAGEEREHAKKAFWYHIIPCISLFLGLGILYFLNEDKYTVLVAIASIFFVIVAAYYFILNIVKGIQLLSR